MGQSSSTPQLPRKSTKVNTFGGSLHLEVRTQSKDLEFYKVKSPPLGRGPFGEIREAFHTKLKEKFLMKIIFKQQFSETELKSMQMEYKLLQELAHPNIIGVKEFYDEDRYFYIIQYYFKGRPLFDKVRESNGIRDTQVGAKILSQLAKTLDFINDRGVVYRNLKLENILYNGRQIRLHDFSQAVRIRPKEKLSDMVGSIHFVAPEVIRGAYDTRSDIWSFGIVCYVLFYCRYPFDGKDDSTVMDKILKEQPDYSANPPLPTLAISLVQMILQKRPEDRPTWKEIGAHEFFRQGKSREIDSVKKMFAKVRNNLLTFSIETKFHLALYLHFLHSFFANVEGSSLAQELFAKIDIRSRGRVTFADLKKFNDEFQLDMSEPDLRGIINKIDKDNSSTIEYEEFMASCIDRAKLLTTDKIEAFFSALATTHPDFVSVEDLNRVFVSVPKSELQDFFASWGVPHGEAFSKDLFLKMMQSLIGPKV